MKANIREKLKNKTTLLHHDLEEKLAITSREWNLDSYAALLQRFYVFHMAFERHLQQFPELASFYANRHKSPWLKQDLLKLQRALPPQTSVCDQFLASQGEASSWGLLYVIEGSTLGGQVVSRHFHDVLQITPTQGGAYFASYQEETGQHWQNFIARLNSLTLSEVEEEQAIQAANKLFAFFSSYLVD